MSSFRPNEFDVLVVGGGPAGMAAAISASQCGVRVGIVDDNPTLGGQIWRRSFEDSQPDEAAQWQQAIQARPSTILCGKKIVHQPEPGVLVAEGVDDRCELRYRNLILATGARERFLPFPGWTLPNVMGAGGLDALVRGGLPIAGKRVLIAGTGPLLLAAAAELCERGAKVVGLCEQATLRQL